MKGRGERANDLHSRATFACITARTRIFERFYLRIRRLISGDIPDFGETGILPVFSLSLSLLGMFMMPAYLNMRFYRDRDFDFDFVYLI